MAETMENRQSFSKSSEKIQRTPDADPIPRKSSSFHESAIEKELTKSETNDHQFAEEKSLPGSYEAHGKPNGPSTPTPIKYILSYRTEDRRFKDEEVDSIGSLEPTLNEHSRREAILEVTRIAFIEHMQVDHTIRLSEHDFKINRYGPCELKINSIAIINALDAVVSYWPGLSLNSPSLRIEEPFAVLYQHRKGLEEYAKANSSVVDPENSEKCHRKRNVDKDVELLFTFLDTRPEARKIQLERARYDRPKPVATFEMLWMLFPPGTDVLYDWQGMGAFEGFVVKQTSGGGLTVGNVSPFTITLWWLNFNGDVIGRTETTATIQPFKGEKEIDTLNILPCDFYEREVAGEVSEKSKALRQSLVNNGEIALKLTKRQCVHYSGETYSKPYRPYSGRVVVDQEGFYYDHSDKEKPSLAGLQNDEIIPMPECPCSYCSQNKEISNPSTLRSHFSEYDVLRPAAKDFTGLTSHQKFLCDQAIYGYALNIRAWLYLRVANITDCQWNTTMIDKQLTMNNSARDMIKGLVQRYSPRLRNESSDQEQWKADFISDKGDSQIFLLHGKPGVGKTFTAECAAEYIRRPLLSLNCTDIGVLPNEIEKHLRRFFKKAILWGAVLLLDEADVYLEQRTAHDLQRNALVAAFLRSLEYCHGVLFLTTNRIGPFDDAIVSRIHVILHYDFDDAKRQAVWDIFFQKLERERGRQIRVPYSTRDYTRHHKELLALKWNGREIRNAFQTAVALAEHKNERDPEDGLIVLRDEHFEEVVQMSANFVDYMKRVRGDAEKHAAIRGDRNEHFKGMHGFA